MGQGAIQLTGQCGRAIQQASLHSERLHSIRWPVRRNTMKEILLDPESGYGKQLPNLMMDEIKVQDRQATVRGSYAVLDLALEEIKMGNPIGVPRVIHDWCARQESNL